MPPASKSATFNSNADFYTHEGVIIISFISNAKLTLKISQLTFMIEKQDLLMFVSKPNSDCSQLL